MTVSRENGGSPIELQVMDQKNLNDRGNISQHGSHIRSHRGAYDSEQLARLGKKQILKVGNRPRPKQRIVKLIVLITWEGCTVLFSQPFVNGGPSGVIFSFIVAWLGNFSVFACLSELVSMAPTSGGQYHWVAMLSPRYCSRFLSFTTGWLCVAGWLGSATSVMYLAATLLQGLIALNNPTYELVPYHAVLLIFAIILWCVFINVFVGSVLAGFEAGILILHIVGFFAVLIPLVVMAPHSEPGVVFNSFANGGMFPTLGVSFLVGLIGNAFTFAGADAAFHMVEETHNAVVVVPRAVLSTILINGSTGFAMVIAMVFCIGDPEAAAATPTGYPCIAIFYNATRSNAGATVMAAITVVMGCCGSVGLFASTSRVMWSFARDRAVPGWRTLSKVHPTTSIPVWTVGMTAIITALITLIVLGSTAAFSNIVGIGISGLYSSYLLASGLLLYRRCTSGFKLPDMKESLPALANTTGAELVWGPWHIPGIWGILNNLVAVVYLIVVWFFSFWPTTYAPDAASMNYCCVIVGGIVIFSTSYYAVWGHREYKGPVIDVDTR